MEDSLHRASALFYFLGQNFGSKLVLVAWLNIRGVKYYIVISAPSC
jgi:hypothetical protein